MHDAALNGKRNKTWHEMFTQRMKNRDIAYADFDVEMIAALPFQHENRTLRKLLILEQKVALVVSQS